MLEHESCQAHADMEANREQVYDHDGNHGFRTVAIKIHCRNFSMAYINKHLFFAWQVLINQNRYDIKQKNPQIDEDLKKTKITCCKVCSICKSASNFINIPVALTTVNFAWA